MNKNDRSIGTRASHKLEKAGCTPAAHNLRYRLQSYIFFFTHTLFPLTYLHENELFLFFSASSAHFYVHLLIRKHFSTMKKLLFPLFLLLLTAACKNEKTPSDSSATTKTDSTLFGTAIDDFGMSTLALRTEAGDTLQLLRTSNAGVDATIYGDVTPGHLYAFTATDSLQSLVTAINLTQIQALTADYLVHNARLILNTVSQPDTVQILWLDADSLVAQGRERYKIVAKTKK